MLNMTNCYNVIFSWNLNIFDYFVLSKQNEHIQKMSKKLNVVSYEAKMTKKY